ncbi:SDR family oxidoreductase [Nakamurella endophytica]|nr:SDR family oxidoreductase [Nakamurella endophytica]
MSTVSDPRPLLAVTGVTGAVGGMVARVLASSGAALRLLARDPARVPRLPGAAVARAPYDDGAAVRSALAGVDTVLMVSAAEHPDRRGQHRTFVDAAAAAGVRQVVYTSFLAAAPDSTFTLGRDHWATEEAIRESGMAWTFLRDNLYSDFLPLLAGPDGVIRGPAGDGRLSAVARRDVADVAAVVLRDPRTFAHRRLDLTGPEAFTLAEAAERISAAQGATVRYRPETLEEAFASRAGTAEPWQVEAWVSTYTAIAAGDLEAVSDDVRQVTGHAPRTLEAVLAAGRR